MKDQKHIEMNYRKTCSCCGYDVTKEDRELPDNNDSEGNLCNRCYVSQQMQNWFEFSNMINLVEDNIRNPLNLFKFKYKPFEEKVNICMNLIEKGFINWGF